MNALSDALAVAQARTVQTLSRQFLASQIDGESLTAALDGIGLTDRIEQAQLIECLTALREAGASLGNGTAAKPDEPASKAQLDYIARLADEKGYTAPEGPLTKPQASEIIDRLQKGTYTPDDNGVPF